MGQKKPEEKKKSFFQRISASTLIMFGFILISLNYLIGKVSSTGLENPITYITKISNQKHLALNINYKKPSENIAYPNLKDEKDFWIKVDVANNKTYLMSGHKVIYTMYSSAGRSIRKETGGFTCLTPTGTFHLQDDKGKYKYNTKTKEGNHYWSSFKGNGKYNFESVPMDKAGKCLKEVAQSLGENNISDGSIYLSVPDAKWIYQHVKPGTKIVVANT